ncbi:MAG: flagellar export protein FliJ [Phycisphaerales bacterium]
MAQFVFEFDTVLELREREEKMRMRAVGELEAQRLAVEGRVEALQAGLRAGREEWRDAVSGRGGGGAGGGALSVIGARMAANASLHGVVELQRAAIELAGLAQKIGRARAELLKATVAKKAVELLKRRRFEAWKREQDRRETGLLDDLVVMRHGRATGVDE